MLVKLSAVFSVLGAIFLIAACYLWIQERRLLAEAVPLQATVLGYDSYQDPSLITLYRVRYRYSFEGINYEAVDNRGSSVQPYAQGERIPIYLHRDRPGQAYVASGVSPRAIGRYVFMALSAACLLVAGLLRVL